MISTGDMLDGRPVIWTPFPGPQTRFLECGTDEILFGGAAGGGKSDSLLAGYLRFVNEPRYTGIIFRRTFPQLADIIERSYVMMLGADPGARYNDSKHFWRFSSGARLFFGHMQSEKDKFNYKSLEYQYIGFDQLEDFTQTMYLYMTSRARSSTKIPIRFRASANPGGIGQDWIMQRWAPWLDPKSEKKAEPGAVLYYRNTNEGYEWCERGPDVDGRRNPRIKGRTFIPAMRKDNPALDGTGYDELLEGLDPVTRAQLKDGDWLVKLKAGDYFKRQWVIGEQGERLLEEEPDDVRWLRYWDRAATVPTKKNPNPDWTAGVKMGLIRSGPLRGKFVVSHVVRARLDPGGVEDLVSRTAATDGKQCEIGIEQDPAAAGVAEAAAYLRLLVKYAVEAHPATKAKLTRFKPFSAQAKAGNVVVVRGPWNNAWFDELEAFPDPDVWKDDQVDATSGAYNVLTANGPTTASNWKRAASGLKKSLGWRNR